jgi:hypothetical protein
MAPSNEQTKSPGSGKEFMALSRQVDFEAQAKELDAVQH